MDFEVLEREGWAVKCPHCAVDIRYTLIRNVDPPVPFFYAENCNDVLLRKSDQALVDELFDKSPFEKPKLDELENLWHEILVSAPPAPCGGKFGFWSNIKCPNCLAEIPYNRGIKNAGLRIHESKIVLVNGASMIGDSEEDSWVVKVNSPNSSST